MSLDNLTFTQQVIIQIIIGLFIIGGAGITAYIGYKRIMMESRRIASENLRDESQGTAEIAKSVQILQAPLNDRIIELSNTVQMLEAQISDMNGLYRISIDLKVGEKPEARVVSVIKSGQTADLSASA